MAHEKILEADYNEKIGLSKVVKGTKFGRFTGYAWLNSEDEDIANEWDGCAIAEYDCDIQIHQKKAEYYRERWHGMCQMYQTVCDTINSRDHQYVDETKEDWEPDEFQEGIDEVLQVMYNVEKNYYNEYMRERGLYRTLKDNRNTYIDERLKQRRKIRERIAAKEAENNE